MSQSGGWEVVREAVRQRVGPSAYNAWFRTLAGHVESETLVIRCPDRFSRDWLRRRYGSVIAESAGAFRRVEYRIDTGSRAMASSGPAAADAAGPEEIAHPGSTPASAFDGFVVDPGNALALEAARAVARGQAGRCTPLFLSGASGVGKTHLCRAIQQELPRETLYRSSEEFTSEVTGAMRSGQMQGVRHRYRRVANVLILEDVQFLEGKNATQVELFHTIEHLISTGRPVVLTGDRPPSQIRGLDPKLASRMASGLVAMIAPPGYETRLAILREKATGGGVNLDADCLHILASRPVTSARDLIAGLNQVVARASLLRARITPELVLEALCAVDIPGRPHTIAEIMALVAQAYGVTREELRGPSRQRRIVRPRQIGMYLCRRYTDSSFNEIGRAFDRDHTSVMYAVETVERRIVEKPQLRYEIEALAARIGRCDLPPVARPATRPAARVSAATRSGSRRTGGTLRT